MAGWTWIDVIGFEGPQVESYVYTQFSWKFWQFEDKPYDKISNQSNVFGGFGVGLEGVWGKKTKRREQREKGEWVLLYAALTKARHFGNQKGFIAWDDPLFLIMWQWTMVMVLSCQQ